MSTIYTVMAYGGMALAVICFVLAVIFFFGWDIPKVFGDVTGRTEKKAIERIQREGYGTNGSKRDSIKASGETAQIKVRRTITDGLTGEISEKIRNNRLLAKVRGTNLETAVTQETTGVNINVNRVMPEDLNPEEDTTVLTNQDLEEDTTVLNSGSEEDTMLLGQEEEATVVLEEKGIPGVIHLPNEVFTQLGTVAPVLDFVVIHTEDEIS